MQCGVQSECIITVIENYEQAIQSFNQASCHNLPVNDK